MGTEVRRPRTDAEDNRDRILAAALLVFTAEGSSAPVREVARRARVGVATVYRHFPTKQALFDAAFTEDMTLCTAIVQEGLAAPDPWQGLALAVERLVTTHGGADPRVAAVHAHLARSAAFAPAREQAVRDLRELIRRAKESGALREDVGLDDVVLTMQAGRGIRAASPAAQAAATRRLAELILQSFRAVPRTSPSSAPGQPASGRGVRTP
ncbi:TetR/AcrR family transcriptional regulator [Streptomyces physcomitrii]|uniref:TetR/AcrR family transcriptional regulator n=1 Tax=Streptomyces physcomitrii TaxID=2724184 RepID=A0ABX1H4B1_9ACTN|nr:TetR/AcrR family transcriptional regulator [Streptomyces physcomitrii]NKI42858.1 TetR/AcrR family transcriptional regulator [Streptomyces physcomitrii]